MASFVEDEVACRYAQGVANKSGIAQVVEMNDQSRWAVRPAQKSEPEGVVLIEPSRTAAKTSCRAEEVDEVCGCLDDA